MASLQGGCGGTFQRWLAAWAFASRSLSSCFSDCRSLISVSSVNAKLKTLLVVVVGGGLTVDLNLLDNCCPLLLGDLFVNKHYLTSASRSMSPLPITTERLCFWERLTLQCVNPTAWERNLRRWSQPASPSAAAACHWFGFEKFKPGLLSGPVERDPPLGSVVTFSWSETLLVLGWREPSQSCECF